MVPEPLLCIICNLRVSGAVDYAQSGEIFRIRSCVKFEVKNAVDLKSGWLVSTPCLSFGRESLIWVQNTGFGSTRWTMDPEPSFRSVLSPKISKAADYSHSVRLLGS